MVNGGKMAYIDLSKNKVIVRDIPEAWCRSFLGGRGINMFLLNSMLDEDIDPLGPQNKLIVGVGLLVGVPALGAGRCNVSARSPLTGAVGDSNVGGHFALALRLSGFDHLVISGRAPHPVAIWARDGEIEVRDVSHLWGMDAFEAQEALRKELGDVQSLVIGQAGERLVRFACARTGSKSAAGRTGMGAVMGSKKVKAIIASGRKRIEWFDPSNLYRYARELNDQVMKTKWAQAQARYGTMAIFNHTYFTGLLRAKNFQTCYLDDVGTLEPENIDKYSRGTTGCSACTIKCRHRHVLDRGPYPHVGDGPEYSQLGSFGTMVGCNSMETVMSAAYLCNKYGLDTIETGNIIAWAMELYEKGIISPEDSDGIKLEWGNEQAVYEMIEKIALRQGIGDVLAEGFRHAIPRFGEKSRYYAVQVKGMGTILSDDRPVPSFALGLATATRGSDHLRSRPALDLYGLPEDFLTQLYGGKVSSDYTSYEGKSRMVWWHELEYAVADSLGICKFQTIFCAVHAPSFPEWSRLIYYATGMSIGVEELMTIGERICTIERIFNNRQGFSRRDDYLPDRYYLEPTSAGLPRVRGRIVDREKFDRMLDEYYALHGWDSNGVPRPETLARLGIDDLPKIHEIHDIVPELRTCVER